jgi:hypothetical protein
VIFPVLVDRWKTVLQEQLRLSAAYGYPAQEFISVGSDSLKVWPAKAVIRMTVPG